VAKISALQGMDLWIAGKINTEFKNALNEIDPKKRTKNLELFKVVNAGRKKKKGV
jgi:hypothetical protein